MHLEGDIASGFEPVADVFAAGLRSTPQAGAALCVIADGRRVVDLAGGRTDDGTSHVLDTVQPVFSATKGVTATAIAHLLAAGRIDLDAPVASYWPEFGGAGKADVTVAMLLSHQAGLPCCAARLTRAEVLDGRSVAGSLATQPPSWRPGGAHGYHAVTYGFLAGELVRQVDGRSLGTYVAEELATDLDLWIGLPAAEAHRVAALVPGAVPPDRELLVELARFAPDRMPGRALTLGGVLPVAGRAFAYNDPEVLAAELPASNAVCSARGLATLYARLVDTVDGVRSVDDAVIEAITGSRADGPDLVLGRPTRFGVGFMLPTQDQPFLSPHSFGHPGAGGSVGLADRHLRVALAYTTTGLGAHVLADPRATALVDSVRACVAA